MMSKLSASLILVAALSAALAHGSAIKGHQPAQRAEVKSPVALQQQQPQQQERNPKSAPAPGQSAAPILESSKKVYNDISYRRSPVQQPAAEPVQQVAAAAPAAAAEQPAKEAPASAQEAPKADAAPAEPLAKAAETAKPSDELPPHSVRSAPVQEEAKQQAAPVVVVMQAVPAKVPADAPQQQAPVAAEPKPEPQVQPAPVVPAAAQPEPVAEPAKAAAAQEASLMAKKDEPAAPKDSGEPIEVPAPDPGLVLSEPIDSTTKLLIDLDEHVQKFLPAEDKQEAAQPAKEAVLIHGVDYSPAAAAHAAAASDAQPSGKSSAPLMPYSSNVENEPIVPPLPSSLDKVEKATGGAQSPPSPTSSAASSAAGASAPSQQSATRQANHQHQNQQQVITQLLDQLDSLQNRIQDTINQLVARRRYVMSALLRPMGTYVRRVRTNLERLQNRVNQLQAAASSVGGNNNPNQRPGGFVDAAAIETIRRRIDDISKRISDIVNRIRFSLTPTSAPLNSNGRK